MIHHVTVPNTVLNLCNRVDQSCEGQSKDGIELFQVNPESFNKSCLDKVEYFSGDWGDLSRLLLTDDIKEDEMEEAARDTEKKFDMILSSETIYNADNHEKLLNVFSSCLKPTGIVYPLLTFNSVIFEESIQLCYFLP